MKYENELYSCDFFLGYILFYFSIFRLVTKGEGVRES